MYSLYNLFNKGVIDTEEAEETGTYKGQMQDRKSVTAPALSIFSLDRKIHRKCYAGPLP